MSDNVHESGGTGPSHRTVEIAVGGAIALMAIIGMYGSMKVGIGWGAEGPQAGFFPFYVSAIVLIACVINIASAFRDPDTGKLFAKWHELSKVTSVVVPTAIYAGLIPFLGLYVASALLIGVFMHWFGKYKLPVVLGVAISFPIIIFFMFEIWFLVPLPKGPLEQFLGY